MKRAKFAPAQHRGAVDRTPSAAIVTGMAASPWITSLPSSPKMTSSPAPPTSWSLPKSEGVGAKGVVEDDRVAFRHVGRPGLRAVEVEQVAVVVEHRVTGQHVGARADVVAGAQDGGVVARDHIIAGAAVDHIVAVLAAGDVMPADQVVVAVLTVEDVGALLAEDDVVAGAGKDHVVPRDRPAGGIDVLGEDRDKGEGLDRRGQGQERQVDVARDLGAWSPNTRSLPAPLWIVSPAVPPITRSLPVPVKFRSTPPSAKATDWKRTSAPLRSGRYWRMVAGNHVVAVARVDPVGRPRRPR